MHIIALVINEMMMTRIAIPIVINSSKVGLECCIKKLPNVDLYHAAVARDMETVSRLQPLVMQISSSIYTVGQHGSSYLKGLKCALSLLGVCDDFVAAPFHRFNVPEREKIRKALEALPFCPELKS